MIDTSPLDRHGKIALSFSGGKDSLVCVHMLRDHWDKLTIYHMDTGDLLPEMRDSVARVEAVVPHFVRVQGNVRAWIQENGLPTDLLPYGTHPVGRLMGQAPVKLMPRYDCCYTNLMMPLFNRVRQDGNTLLIRGTKSVDMARLPVGTGDCRDGVEYWYPIQDWTHEQVFAYLREHNIPLPRVYENAVNAPECARCTAWWGEGRAAYLKKHHPELHKEYHAQLTTVVEQLRPSLNLLKVELGEV